MTHTYHITGITCDNCAATVRNKLSSVLGVSGVTVDLEKQQAEVTTQIDVPEADLHKALSGTKYSISSHEMDVQEEAVTWKTYLPVFLLFGYITIATLLIQYFQGRFDIMEWMRHFMAGFFLSFSFFKLLDIPAFAMSYSTYDIVAKRWPGYGYAYPFIELGLGIAYMIPAELIWVNATTFIVMGVSIIGVVRSMMQKRSVQCACLGAVFKLPVGKITLLEDVMMLVMSGASLLLIML